jgi:predicted AlkP superfamily phosphohydrolase/phosphomutase
MAAGDYMPDVKGFRTENKSRLLSDIYTMVERRFRTACDLVVGRPWDFFMMVEIGPDRMHHGFWRYANPDHRLYEPGNPYEHALRDFYRFLDSWLGTLLGRFDDTTTVVVLSDHGTRTMVGGVCINEWLVRNGYLVLKPQANGQGVPTPDTVDWERTTAWSEGGYYARVFLNVRGREPQGTIDPARYESFREELKELIKAIPDPDGRPMDTRVLKPENLYRQSKNIPPDLLVYFDNLARRSVGTVGHGQIHVQGNDTGPDDANHDPDGIFIATRLRDFRRGIRKNLPAGAASCLDVTPTILQEFGLPLPQDLAGKPIALNHEEQPTSRVKPLQTAQPLGADYATRQDPKGYTPEEEEIIKQRLTDLGYL